MMHGLHLQAMLAVLPRLKKERSLFLLNVSVKLLLKNFNLVSAEPGERNAVASSARRA